MVGFDLDGTLYDEMDFISQVYSPIARFLSDALRKRCQKEIYSAMLNRWIEKGSSYPFIFSETISQFFPPEVETRQLELQCVKIFRDYSPKLTISARNKHWLSYLRDIYPLFIVSDGQYRLQTKKIEVLELNRWFAKDAICITSELGQNKDKPCPEAFNTLRLNCRHNVYDPSEIVYFGDRSCDEQFCQNTGMIFIQSSKGVLG